MKKGFILFAILLFSINPRAYSQTFCQNLKVNSTAGRFEKYVYKNYLSEKRKEKSLKIGLVRPIDDLPNEKRPLIIGVHGGGFIDFCPFEPCYAKYSENVLVPNFTAQGYITASIQYRLTSAFDLKPPKIKDEALREAQYKAIQDARDAIRYVFENAEKLGVDTRNVFLIGTSAGAIIALHAAFLDDEEVPKNLSAKYGGLAEREKIRGVISLSGAIYDLAYLDGGDKVPLMIVHGSEDIIVPFDKGFYLKMKHLTPVFGGKAVFEAARRKGIEAEGYFYDFGHDYPGDLSTEIFKKANGFVHSHLDCSIRNRPLVKKK